MNPENPKNIDAVNVGGLQEHDTKFLSPEQQETLVNSDKLFKKFIEMRKNVSGKLPTGLQRAIQYKA